MKTEEITARVVQILVSDLGVREAEVQLGSRLKEDLDADSLDKIELLYAIEEEFEIDLPDDEADRVHTVADLIVLVGNTKAKRVA